MGGLYRRLQQKEIVVKLGFPLTVAPTIVVGMG